MSGGVMKIKDCQLEVKERRFQKTLGVSHRLERNLLVTLGFNEGTAVEEAKRCLGNIRCESCDLCRLFCPDLCVTRNEKTGKIEIDYDFCKACGICASVCPKGAIKMVLEE